MLINLLFKHSFKHTTTVYTSVLKCEEYPVEKQFYSVISEEYADMIGNMIGWPLSWNRTDLCSVPVISWVPDQ